ncbi:MAG: M16 family metallopeptidase [Hydrogenophilus thermoluteolus]
MSAPRIAHSRLFPRRLYHWLTTVALALLVGFGLTTPVRAAVSDRFVVDGVPVDFVMSPGIPLVDVIVSFDAGSRRDPPGKAGLAALTRTLLTAGTTQHDEQALSEAFADLATDLTGGVDPDRATLSWRTLAKPEIRSAAATLVAEVLSDATFPEAVFAREQARMIAGLRDALTRPEVLAERALTAAIYRDHPYGQLTTEASLAQLTRDDVVAFFKRHYTRATAQVTIVGALTHDEAAALARTLVAALPPGEALPALPPVPAPATTPQTIVRDHPSEQTHWAIGMAVLSRDDPDYFPLLVGNWILGGGSFSARLMQEVREKRGYAYSVYSALEPLAQPGPFVIRLQTRGRHADAAREVVAATLARFLAEGPTPEELALAKRALADGFGLRIDSNRKLAAFLSVVGYYRLPPDWLERYPEAVRAVTIEQIRDAFRRRIDPNALVWVRVGGAGDQPNAPSSASNAPPAPDAAATAH